MVFRYLSDQSVVTSAFFILDFQGGGEKKTLNALIFTPNAEFCKIKQHAQDIVA